MIFPRLVLLGTISLLSVACESLNQPLSNSSGFDPLGTPGARSIRQAADKLLSSGESVKVIGQEKSYVKVELEDGSIGYIPSMMLSEPLSSNARVVAGTGAAPAYSVDIPDLPEPIEDPGNPDDIPPSLPGLSDDTPVAPLPQGDSLSPLPKPAGDLPNLLAPLPETGNLPIPIVPLKPEDGAEDNPPPLPTPAG